MILANKKIHLGFTLTELLVIFAIIAILVLAAVMSFSSQLHKGNDSKRKADLNLIKIAVEEYEKDHNCYPDAALMNVCGTGAGIPIHPYLTDVPCDPVPGNAYFYENDGASCPVWFRIYTTLQYTKDASAIPGVGPGDTYNFYMSSDNAPNFPNEGSNLYGCIEGVCTNLDRPNTCSSTWDLQNCNGSCGQPIYSCSFL